MEETKNCGNLDCPDCKKRAEEMKESEAMAFAFLVALMPLMTVTLFSNMGLF